MITYIVHTIYPPPWTGNQRDQWNFYIRYLSRFITFCELWDPFIKVVWQTWRLRFSYSKFPLHLQQYNRVSSWWCIHLAKLARAWSSYGDFIDRGMLLTIKLVDQGYTLEKLKIYFRKFYGRYNDLIQHYNTPFTVFVWTSLLLMCVAYPGFNPTGYDWLYSWFHGGCMATSGEAYSSRAPVQTLGLSYIVWTSRNC